MARAASEPYQSKYIVVMYMYFFKFLKSGSLKSIRLGRKTGDPGYHRHRGV